MYRGSLVSAIVINESSLVFKLPSKLASGENQLIPNILSYKSNCVVEKKFKEEPNSVSVVFLTEKGYDWYKELTDCNSLFYKA